MGDSKQVRNIKMRMDLKHELTNDRLDLHLSDLRQDDTEATPSKAQHGV